MDEAAIADFKQFIAATVSQQFSFAASKDDLLGLATKEDLKSLATKEDIAKLDKKIDAKTNEILAAVGDTMANHSEVVDEQLTDHETRLVKLESKAA